MERTALVLTAASIADAAAGRIVAGNAHTSARGVCTDTRQLEPGQAFFALPGANHDGHDYVPMAAEAGIQLTWTCAPEIVGNAPLKGQTCAWMESAAITYANSAKRLGESCSKP